MDEPTTTARPIIFSGPMVRAILAGHKTQTRRIVADRHLPQVSGPALLKRFIDGQWADRPLPYGQGGDHLWVREAWRVGAWDSDEGTIAVEYLADGSDRREMLSGADDEQFERLWIQSTDDAAAAGLKPDGDGNYHWEPGESPTRARSPLYLPIWASRIRLELTGLRVERLQEIGEAEAITEGMIRFGDGEPYWQGAPHRIKGTPKCHPTAVQAYADHWDHINGKRAPWSANPLVWVLDFKRVNP